MAAAAIFHHALAAGQTAAANMVTPLDSGTSGTSGTSGASGSSGSGDSGDSGTISANDFLTLLVTEMQNQDPTNAQDPNEYINQLVQVNSLEQLIDINQTLSGALDGSTGTGSTSSSDSSSSPATAAGVAASELEGGSSTTSTGVGPSPIIGHRVEWLQPTSQPVGAPQLPGSGVSSGPGTPVPEGSKSPGLRAAGNFTVPKASPAASRVAHALAGRTHAAAATAAPTAATN